MMRKTIYAIAVVFALAAFAGCGSSSSDDSSDTGTTGAATQASTTSGATAASGDAVDIKNFAFAPPTLNVKQGATLTFTNDDQAPHTATADNKSFDTGTLNPGDTKTVTFKAPGTIAYTCEIHPFMHGTIVVQ
jgi:plastocyanin